MATQIKYAEKYSLKNKQEIMLVSTQGPRITVGQETEVAEPITKHTSNC